MKKLSNLKGAKALNNKEQQSIKGGHAAICRPAIEPGYCPEPGWYYHPKNVMCCNYE